MALNTGPVILDLDMHLQYGIYGKTETVKMVPPGNQIGLAGIQAVLNDALKLCQHRANLFPEDVYMTYAVLSYEGGPRDRLQILESNLIGLYQSGAYKFPAPDGPRRCIVFSYTTDDGHTSDLTVNGISDDWAGKAAPGFNSGNIGLRTPPANLPALGNFTTQPHVLLQKFIDSVLKVGVFGRKTPGNPNPVTFQTSPYAYASYQAMGYRKWGKPYRFSPGRRAG